MGSIPPDARDEPAVPPAAALVASARARGISRWFKPIVTIALYALIFYWTDVGAIARRLSTARIEYVAGGILLYMTGQAVSAYKWQVLLAPVGLAVRYSRILAFYYTGMFFNLFLPTIVGGDAVKAVLLTQETGAPARSTMSVFMERNVGLLALLTIATTAAVFAPRVHIGGFSLMAICALLAIGFVSANIMLGYRTAYVLVDRLIALTPLRHLRARAASLYEAVARYRSAPGALVSATLLSFIFQFVVVGVVFLNARALDLEFPLSALAVFVPLISLGGMLPLTVNGLGVREALYILFFGRLGVPTELSVSLALLFLAVTFVSSLPGGLVYALQRSPSSRVAGGRSAADRVAMRRP
jgi:glycosyltransferase 2 family protein